MSNGTNSENGVADWEKMRAPTKTYTTNTGVTWPLRRIPAMIVRQLYNDQTGKPKPPIVEVTYGKKTVKEANENDPDYKVALDKWEEDHNFRILTYVLTQGVSVELPKEELNRLKEFLPGSSPAQLKYAWILESFESDEEAGIMSKVIIGQSVPTDEGIADAEASFPGDTEPK